MGTPYDALMAAALEKLPAWMHHSEPAILERVRATNREGAQNWSGISPFVTESVLWSVYSFLASPDDYWKALCKALAVGGDVDTTGAMTGAIAGARSGLANLPQEFACRVTDQGTWGYSELVGLGRKLASIRRRTVRDWQVETETRLSVCGIDQCSIDPRNGGPSVDEVPTSQLRQKG